MLSSDAVFDMIIYRINTVFPSVLKLFPFREKTLYAFDRNLTTLTLLSIIYDP